MKNEQKVIHEMKLNNAPFCSIQSGEKRIEMRLFDEKRQAIAVRDSIRFTNTENGEYLLCRVVALHRFPDFHALYAKFDKTELGYAQDEQATPDDMFAYYPKEKVAQYGVLGIEIQTE